MYKIYNQKQPLLKISAAGPNSSKAELNERLFNAILEDEPQALIQIQNLLAAGAEINSRNVLKDNRTPLSIAVEQNQPISIIRALLKAGADINVRDAKGNIPLLYAYSVPLVQEFLNYGANPFSRSIGGSTFKDKLHYLLLVYDYPEFWDILELLPHHIFQALYDNDLDRARSYIRIDPGSLTTTYQGATPCEFVARRWQHLINKLNASPPLDKMNPQERLFYGVRKTLPLQKIYQFGQEFLADYCMTPPAKPLRPRQFANPDVTSQYQQLLQERQWSENPSLLLANLIEQSDRALSRYLGNYDLIIPVEFGL